MDSFLFHDTTGPKLRQSYHLVLRDLSFLYISFEIIRAVTFYIDEEVILQQSVFSQISCSAKTYDLATNEKSGLFDVNFLFEFCQFSCLVRIYQDSGK